MKLPWHSFFRSFRFRAGRSRRSPARKIPAVVCGGAFWGVALGFAGAAELPKPLFSESLDTLQPGTPNTTLSATALGPGKFAQAVLIERAATNLLAAADFPNVIGGAWKSEHGVVWEASETRIDGQKGAMRIPSGGILRQTVGRLKPKTAYCFSVYARSADGKPAKFALEWERSEEKEVKEGEVGRDWQRFWVGGRALGGNATPTIRGLSGTVLVERPQFEAWGPLPSSYLLKGSRRAGGLVWKSVPGAAPLLDGSQGTFSFWIKPLWAGQTTDLIADLFSACHDPSEPWKTARSAMAFRAYLGKPDAKDYRYSMTLTIRDQEGTSRIFSIPAHDLTAEWHHLAISWNFSNPGEAWVAGYLDGRQAFHSGIPDLRGMEGFHQITFGDPESASLGGWLDEVAIYGVALDESAIRQLAHPSP